MQEYSLPKDIAVLCIQATSFPEGIVEAHKKLHALIPSSKERRFFGISHRNLAGEVIYFAAAEQLKAGEDAEYDCETFVVLKGEYIGVRINNFEKDVPRIAKTFKKLRAEPNIDPNGACVEMFLNEEDILCLVKLKD
jgi:hypothetical protein